MKRKSHLFAIFVTVVVGSLSLSCVAQEKSETEADSVYDRAETLLQTIRDKKWDEIINFVVVKTAKKDKATKTRMNISDKDSEEEIAKKTGDFFKQVYGVDKPGKIMRPIRFNKKDPTLATVTYRHGDIDNFNMRNVAGEWFYTLDYK